MWCDRKTTMYSYVTPAANCPSICNMFFIDITSFPNVYLSIILSYGLRSLSQTVLAVALTQIPGVEATQMKDSE